jgi:hypothetical protein
LALGACQVAEPCGAIVDIGILLGGAILATQVQGDNRAQPILASAQETRLLNWVANSFCVDRRMLGALIHDEKVGRQRGKGSDLTLEEIRELARSLPKLKGCTPTAQ